MSTRTENTDPAETHDQGAPSRDRPCRNRNAEGTRCSANGPRPRRRKLIGIVALTLIIAAVFCMGHGPHARMTGPHFSEAQVERMVNHLVDDASDAQKTRMTTIVRDAFHDLDPVRKQVGQTHTRLMRVLAAPVVDRSALEALRSQQLALADQASRVVTAHVADAADVLTPQQRVELVEHLQRRFED